MVDVGTGLALFGPAQLASRLLGPTADYIGEGIKEFTARRVENVKRIAKYSIRMLGPRLEEPGSVPPRILRAVLDDGSFVDDELTAQYYGGVLASSRVSNARDDSSIVYTSILSRMSTYQIRTHYILYVIAQSVDPPQFNAVDPSNWDMLRYRLTLDEYQRAMDLTAEEEVRLQPLVEQVFFGLSKEGLIDTFEIEAGEAQAITFTITIFGVQLFLAAHALSANPVSDFFNPEYRVKIEPSLGLAIPAAAVRLL